MKRVHVLVSWALAGCGPTVATHGDETGRQDPEPSTSLGEGTVTGSTTSTSEGSLEEAEATTLAFDVPSDTESDCLVWAHSGCPFEDAAIGSLVHGGTPLGEFDVLPFAFFAAHSWCDWCVERANIERVVFVSDPGVLKDLGAWGEPAEGLELMMLDFEGPTGRELVGTLAARRNGETAYTQAIFSLDTLPSAVELAEPFDPSAAASVSGEVLASGNGWSIHGRFQASYCPAINYFAICE